MPREDAPLEKVEVESKVRAYAKEHGLIFDEYFLSKIRWSEEHGGRCFCNWDSDRQCPCSHVQKDLIRYNGTCLCSVLCTPEKMKKRLKYRNHVQPIRITKFLKMVKGVIHNIILFSTSS